MGVFTFIDEHKYIMAIVGSIVGYAIGYYFL